ncbi:hypothetical protein KJ812_02380 [Patescibacteria group bacterium]|nr:hypothetical protein [Patescibacteria group bacterium]
MKKSIASGICAGGIIGSSLSFLKHDEFFIAYCLAAIGFLCVGFFLGFITKR